MGGFRIDSFVHAGGHVTIIRNRVVDSFGFRFYMFNAGIMILCERVESVLLYDVWNVWRVKSEYYWSFFISYSVWFVCVPFAVCYNESVSISQINSQKLHASHHSKNLIVFFHLVFVINKEIYPIFYFSIFIHVLLPLWISHTKALSHLLKC